MKKKLLLIGFYIPFTAIAQLGINTTTPHPSAALQVESTNKGILIPRVNITNTASQLPISTTPKDGLLVYNSGTAPGTSQTLYFWDSAANSGSGGWNKYLYFKETPKVAYIGLSNNTLKLDNFVAGDFEPLVKGAINNYYIINSGYMPLLDFVYDSSSDIWEIVLAPGSYTMEILHQLNAPPANPVGNAATIQGSYYNMGYFSDLDLYEYDPADSSYGNSISSKRVEGAVVSKINENHTVRLLHSFDITTTAVADLYIGRMAASSFNDQVNLLANGTVIKITKLK